MATIKGTVRSVGETKQVSDRFSKRAVIVETADNPKYPQVLELEASNDRCSLLDSVGAGDSVSAEIDIRGREWRSPSGDVKYFTTLSIYKIEVTTKAPPAQVGATDPGQIPF